MTERAGGASEPSPPAVAARESAFSHGCISVNLSWHQRKPSVHTGRPGREGSLTVSLVVTGQGRGMETVPRTSGMGKRCQCRTRPHAHAGVDRDEQTAETVAGGRVAFENTVGFPNGRALRMLKAGCAVSTYSALHDIRFQRTRGLQHTSESALPAALARLGRRCSPSNFRADDGRMAPLDIEAPSLQTQPCVLRILQRAAG
ncbi:hypothetical protein C8Q80DRAFT_641873 [Daedaleopsis nitida]|nr:hypothetical protein C8Q80DRAFT_641873 [Daedaleopsis nitida]